MSRIRCDGKQIPITNCCASNVMDSDEDQQDHSVLSGALASEFNLEIGIRERMAQTLDARIAWAILLKESLGTGALALLWQANGS